MMLSQQQMTAPEHSSDLTILPVSATTEPASAIDTPCAWQAKALEAYAVEVGAEGAQLRAELAARIHTLTGCAIAHNAIAADSGARRATTALDGVVFQLRGGDLILLRPCAYCGTGQFQSLPLSSHVDLGYAISGWQPYHAECEPCDSTDTDW